MSRRRGKRGRQGVDPLAAALVQARQLHAQGRAQAAEQAYRAILAARREHPAALKGLADLALASGRLPMALELLQYCVAIAPGDAEAHHALARAQRRSGLLEQAQASLDAALSLQRKSPGLHNELGLLLAFQGRQAEAEAAFRHAIGLDGGYVEAHYNLAGLKQFYVDDPDLQALLGLEARRDSLSPRERVALDFALGKAWDDCGDYPRAFAALARGNRAVRAERPYDHAAMEAAFERCRAVFTPARVERLSGQGSTSAVPLVIVGMPRSGSTLLEHRLAAHPRVSSAGEGPWLLHSLQTCQASGGAQGVDPLAWFADLDDDGLRALGDDYVARLQGQAGRQERVIDKSLLNFLHLGLLALMLPHATLLHCRRHPLDTGISIFQQYFTEGQNFAFDLKDIGRFYDLYRRYLDLWHARFPGRIVDVDYEDLVTDTEGEVRRVVTASGLDWAPECLAQAAAAGRFNTASKAQVARPVYGSSLGRWRHYEQQLAPLRAVLEDEE